MSSEWRRDCVLRNANLISGSCWKRWAVSVTCLCPNNGWQRNIFSYIRESGKVLVDIFLFYCHVTLFCLCIWSHEVRLKLIYYSVLVYKYPWSVPFLFQCSLAESHMSDILTVSLDHTGSVIAVSMSTSPAICEGRHIRHEHLQNFNTTVFVKHMEQGPV
jgi:hypothetical protein